jgi:hypothetical protein
MNSRFRKDPAAYVKAMYSSYMLPYHNAPRTFMYACVYMPAGGGMVLSHKKKLRVKKTRKNKEREESRIDV